MQLLPSAPADTGEIFRLYKNASDYQAAIGSIVVWPEFAREMVEQELREGRQWKMLIDNQIACVWAIAFDDPQIWGARNADSAIYIHRIATNPAFRGQKLVEKIVQWAKDYARQHGQQFVRLDTIGENHGLIAHYTACGFHYLGLVELTDTVGLPAHYHDATVSLFELPVGG
ncbi:GNAT family N-acetyltransferase [Hymenobacter sp. UV11]|uniref:GNAT family N-acetyltransferase n=1 Tax=Hymenobacter sp. UV11 TaxID=1849735 RepID=UPI00105F275C|nr:GNAT family N-acetyltransferase [Hymenobacter sp. UV11]TDN37183.1 GNAT family acetyltransferase [Hymenobacter sp. UV11]TFZ67693.1 GNAT family N-acetyltransferase [Hymenobacter sp. UV11]